jgi:hypothetical protein
MQRSRQGDVAAADKRVVVSSAFEESRSDPRLRFIEIAVRFEVIADTSRIPRAPV